MISSMFLAAKVRARAVPLAASIVLALAIPGIADAGSGCYEEYRGDRHYHLGTYGIDNCTGDEHFGSRIVEEFLMFDGDDTVRSGGNGIKYPDIVKGGAGRDQLSGESGPDSLWGHSSADFLQGGDADDVLHFGGDSDASFSSAGSDDDRLYGGSGDEVKIFGGPGKDKFYDTCCNLGSSSGPADHDELCGDTGSDFADIKDGDEWDDTWDVERVRRDSPAERIYIGRPCGS